MHYSPIYANTYISNIYTIPHKHKYIYVSNTYIPFSTNTCIHIYGSIMVRKCTRLVSIGNTIYTYLFIYITPSYMYTPISLQYTCVCEVQLSIGTSYYNVGG